MVTLADSLISSSSRPLAVRVRPDLSTRRHYYLGQAYWVVKEPIGLKYFRFHDEEYAILNMLDGQMSLDDLKEKFEQQFPPQKITLQELQRFIGTLHRSGLLVCDSLGQGKQLSRRGKDNKRKKTVGALSNVLAIRWRGFDPEWILTWLYRYTFWLFSPLIVLLGCLLVLSALTLVGVQFDVFRSRLPAFHEFFGPSNWIWLGVTMGVVKVLHEFGHGLTCKHFKGECHEIGFMLLVFTPCLYCNVSDSWMLPSKWHRAAIGAAGMYVEIVLASIATFLWWFSEPGLLNHLALSVMFICSVSTILFNGNPLMRFDGYYITADLVEIPNLRQKASTILRRAFLEWCLGLEQPDDPFLPKRNQVIMGLFTIASVCYRWLIVCSIMFFLYKVFEPYGLKIIGQAIAAMALFGLVVQPAWMLAKFLYVPGRLKEVKRHRVLISTAVVGIVLLAVAVVPLPHYVKCSLEVRPRDAASVYVDLPARLQSVDVREGQFVTAGDTMAQLTSADHEFVLAELRGQRSEYDVQFKTLGQVRFHDRIAGRQMPEMEMAMEALDQQIAEKQQELESLHLRAPISGTVLVAAASPQQRPGRLPLRSGSPLATKNVGAHFDAGELFCQIGDPAKLEAVIVIDQADIEFVKRGQPVRIKLRSRTDQVIQSAIVDIARAEMKQSPASLSIQEGGDVATRTDAFGRQRPMSTSYQARAPIKGHMGQIQVGLRGQAKIFTGWQSLGSRIWRYVTRTFHFEL